MPFPQAYFLTWSTYGTRLHGDARGTVDKDHNGSTRYLWDGVGLQQAIDYVTRLQD